MATISKKKPATAAGKKRRRKKGLRKNHYAPNASYSAMSMTAGFLRTTKSSAKKFQRMLTKPFLN